MEVFGVVLLVIAVVGGAIGMGRRGRDQLLKATRPPEEGEHRDFLAGLLDTEPSLFAPDIHWEDHNPRRRPPAPKS